jgi:hypothetical protein
MQLQQWLVCMLQFAVSLVVAAAVATQAAVAIRSFVRCFNFVHKTQAFPK